MILSRDDNVKRCQECGKEFKEVLIGTNFCSGKCEIKHYDKLKSVIL